MSKAPIILLAIIFTCLHSKAQNGQDKLSDTIIVGKINCQDCHDTIIYSYFKCGLYIGSNGSIGLRTHRAIDDLAQEIPFFYLTTLRDIKKGHKRNDYEREIKDVIDTSSFRCLNESYWADKKHIYVIMANSDGGSIYLHQRRNIKAFKPLGDSRFATDNRNAYYLGTKMKHIDVNSFKLLDTFGNYACDKNGVYDGYKKLSEEQIKALELEQYRKK